MEEHPSDVKNSAVFREQCFEWRLSMMLENLQEFFFSSAFVEFDMC